MRAFGSGLRQRAIALNSPTAVYGRLAGLVRRGYLMPMARKCLKRIRLFMLGRKSRFCVDERMSV